MRSYAAFIVAVAGLFRSVTSTLPTETVPGASAWQSNLTTLHERLQYLYTSGHYSDLIIDFPKDNKNVSVHRLVLAASSPVFGSILMGSSAVGDELAVQDSHETFAKVLDQMYLDKMDLQSVDEALRVYATSYKYQVHSANIFCSQYIITHLTKETILAALEASVEFADEKLMKTCVTMLNKDPDAAIAPKAVLGLKKETLKGLLQKELYVSSEVLIFRAVLAWGKAQLSHRGEDASGNALRREVEDLLKEVRLLTLKCDEFIDNVVDTEVFSPSESIGILRAIRGANETSIPDLTPVSRSTKSRARSENYLITAPLSCYSSNRVYYNAHNRQIVNTFKVNKGISLHSIKTSILGSIIIMDNNGVDIASASSSSTVFKFSKPVYIEESMGYKIAFISSSRNRIYRRAHDYVFNFGTTIMRYTSHYCVVNEMKFWA